MPHKSGRGWLRCGGWERESIAPVAFCYVGDWFQPPAAAGSPPAHCRRWGDTDTSTEKPAEQSTAAAVARTKPRRLLQRLAIMCTRNVNKMSPLLSCKKPPGSLRWPGRRGGGRRRAAVRSPTLSTLRLQAAPVEFQTLTAAHVYQLHSIYSTVTSTQRQLYHRWEQALRWPWRNQ